MPSLETCPNCDAQINRGVGSCGTCAYQFPMGYWDYSPDPTTTRSHSSDPFGDVEGPREVHEVGRLRRVRIGGLVALLTFGLWGFATAQSASASDKESEACRLTCEESYAANHEADSWGDHMSGCMSDCLRVGSEPVRVADAY
ncbi:MAG: hypothetical protein ACI9OJ_001831 [Myxococcota bacterium]|jgi:hypothetical protein